MRYGVQFGIESWNDMLFGKTVKDIRNNLEDFFYTMGIEYKDEDNYYYSFTLADGTQHLARIGYID